MKTIGQIFNELRDEDFFKKKPYIGADSMLSNNDISEQQLTSINREIYIYILNIKNYNDIVIGEKFNVVFNIKDPKSYQKIEAEIDFVSLKKNDNIGIILKGYGGCVRLKFKGEIPEMTKLLIQDKDEIYDKDKHSHIYFTTQEVINRILQEFEKQDAI